MRERGLKFCVCAGMSSGFVSLPLRERGLKYTFGRACLVISEVAPLAGAWIEIPHLLQTYQLQSVAPLAGAWIEINFFCLLHIRFEVAPLAGAWIEICLLKSASYPSHRRSPCGSVD